MDFKEEQQHIEKIVVEQNNSPADDFDGYSPVEMHQILHFTFGSQSPVFLQQLPDSDYKRIPILNQIKYLVELIDKSGGMKLTKMGFLPVKVVSELYQQGFIKDEYIESGISKLYKETDSPSINLTRILIELSGLVNKRKGILRLKKSSAKILADDHELLRLVLLTFATRFAWAYYDEYGENNIGQLGYGFSLVLLSKYGHEKRLDLFYAEKYFKAFPALLESIEPTYGTLESYSADCYSIRTFDRFLDYFGLIRIEEEGSGFDSKKHVTKTDLYDRMIKCMPQKIQQ
jgi:hypothetical protein